MKHLEIFIDGACSGNPGHSGVGIAIFCQGKPVKNISDYIGIATNNVAEYTALIYALREALILEGESLKINTDSQLLARQINRVYKVKNENIRVLFDQAIGLICGFKQVFVNNIPREENALADKLATQAVKKNAKNVLLKAAECGCSALNQRREESPGSGE